MKYLQEKTKYPLQNTSSEVLRRSSGGQCSKFFLDERYGKSRQKIFDGDYCPTTGRSSGFQGKNNHKGNLQHVLCKKSSKLATGRKVKRFFGSMGNTKDSEILEIVKGFKIPFLKNPTQERVPQTPLMGQEQSDLIQVEIENMLKGAIQQTEHQVGEFLGNIFLVGNRDGGNDL